MKVTTTDGKIFLLEGESKADRALLDALDLHRALKATSFLRSPSKTIRGAFENSGANVVPLRPAQPALLPGDAGSQALGALGQIVSLALREAAKHGAISTDAANPQTQEQPAAGLEQLQIVAQTLGNVVLKLELMLQEMRGAHVGSPVVCDAAIVAQGGAA